MTFLDNRPLFTSGFLKTAILNRLKSFNRSHNDKKEHARPFLVSFSSKSNLTAIYKKEFEVTVIRIFAKA